MDIIRSLLLFLHAILWPDAVMKGPQPAASEIRQPNHPDKKPAQVCQSGTAAEWSRVVVNGKVVSHKERKKAFPVTCTQLRSRPVDTDQYDESLGDERWNEPFDSDGSW